MNTKGKLQHTFNNSALQQLPSAQVQLAAGTVWMTYPFSILHDLVSQLRHLLVTNNVTPGAH
jgi:hypothetical protein